MSKILFIQFSNSGAYPPIQNAVTLCLREGHDVSILCTESEGAARLRFPEQLEKITRRLSRSGGRIGLLFLFARFTALVLWKSLFNKTQWIYASDPMAAPAALYARRIFGCRVIYHEHDAPPEPNNRFQGFVNRARLGLARHSDAIVMPNTDRLSLYLSEALCTDRKNIFTVWNCPLTEEIVDPGIPKTQDTSDKIKLYFHGSISPSLLPLNLLSAIKSGPAGVSLAIAGYPTDGGIHLQNIMDESARLGITDRVSYLGSFSREQLLPLCAQHDVGICFYDANPGLVNHRYMAGASNKPFDYLSQGLALLISDSPEQRALFAGLETSLFCDTQSIESIAMALDEICNKAELKKIAQVEGPGRIRDRWNYAEQFRPVLQLLRP